MHWHKNEQSNVAYFILHEEKKEQKYNLSN
jgi:hypothetical protein